ncbi:MAG: sterol-binding protein, partial [Gammaproteobacteria bacterium]|nr:sterol-binding protein [Gammaproteobacteria bacterium]
GKILAAMDIDWEEQLSHFTGDLLAHKTGNLLRTVRNWGTSSSTSLKLDLKEYLQEELRLLPGRLEVETFLGNVDVLRDDVERLQARLIQLQKHRTDNQ